VENTEIWLTLYHQTTETANLMKGSLFSIQNFNVLYTISYKH